MHRGPALWFAIVVWTTATGKKPQAIERTQRIRKRVREALLEPADGAGADAGQHNPGLPSLAKNLCDTPILPYGEHRFSVSAANVNYVLVKQKRSQLRCSFKKRENRRSTVEFQKRRIKTRHIVIRLAARRRNEHYPRALVVSLPEHVFLQLEILSVAVKASTANGNNLSRFA